MEKEKITIQTQVAATRKKTWEAYINPKHITQWNFADPSWHCPRAENDLRIGGRYLARMEAKDGSFGFDFEATYTRLKEYEMFEYVFGDRNAIVTFNENNNHTLVTISFDPETENSIELQRNGWQMILNNFKKYTESLS